MFLIPRKNLNGLLQRLNGGMKQTIDILFSPFSSFFFVLNLLFSLIFTTYVVKDLFPDKRKKVHSWDVPPENVIRFPSLESDVFAPGNRVLSLWNVDNEEWSSMFYRATVVEVKNEV